MADIFLPLTGNRLIILVLYNVLAIMFIVLVIIIYRRHQRNQQRYYLLKFFFYIGLSFIANISYAVIADETIQRIGNNTVTLLATMGAANLMLFTFSLRYSEEQLTRKKSILIQIFVLIAGIIVYFFIPNGTEIQLPDYSPYWSLPLVIYGMILTQCLMITALINGIQIYNNMRSQVSQQVGNILKNQFLRKRYQFLLIGLFFIEILFISAYIGNGQLIDKSTFIILSLSIIPAAIFIYAGVGHQMPKEFRP